MALVDVPGSAEFHPSTVAIILRAARLGLFTTAEAGLLIDRVHAHTITLPLSIQDSNSTGAGQTGSLPVSLDRTVR
jgi:hypothetical protein